MMKNLILLFCLYFLISCGEKEKKQGDLSQDQIEILEESSTINSEDIKYEGTFKGKIKGKDVELTLDGDSFESFEDGKRIHGSWTKLDDGTSIELEPKSGKVVSKFYGYSDNDTWIVLTDSLTYPEKEEFLKRIPN